MTNNSKKSGIVTIIGEVNVGKSSLLNILVKKNISIITHKSNTTTKQIKGIKNYKNSQVIFIDTPGLYFNKGKTNRTFLSEIWNAVSEADFVCLVIDSSRPVSDNIYQLLEQINFKNKLKKRIVLVLNKIDIVKKESLLIMVKEINQKFDFDQIFMISALKNDGIEDLLDWFSLNLSEKKWLYPSNIISDEAGTSKLFVMHFTILTLVSLRNPASIISSICGGNGAEPVHIVAGSAPIATETSIYRFPASLAFAM